MSDAPALRRTDKRMSDAAARTLLAEAYCGRLASVGADGWPYVVPLLHVVIGDELWTHNAAAPGHLRANLAHCARVCFEVDEAGPVFPYGRYDCDTSLSYRSVVIFGTLRVVSEPAARRAFFDALMAKYRARRDDRPAGAYPRLDEVSVYAIAIERLSGKETPLPPPAERWPALDRSRSPGGGRA